jgi:hypothetical protein
MPATRLTMRKIREVLRLKFDCRLTKRQIAKSCAIARSTVAEYLRRFFASGLSWPLSPRSKSSGTTSRRRAAFAARPVIVEMYQWAGLIRKI